MITIKIYPNITRLIKKSQNIGVTAGASTPDAIIENVMKELNKYNT